MIAGRMVIFNVSSEYVGKVGHFDLTLRMNE